MHEPQFDPRFKKKKRTSWGHLENSDSRLYMR